MVGSLKYLLVIYNKYDKQMGEIKAWQCEHCNSIFYNKKDMDRCQKTCINTIQEYNKKKEKHDKIVKLGNEIRMNVEDVRDIPKIISNFVKDNFKRTISFELWNLSFNRCQVFQGIITLIVLIVFLV